MKQILVMMAVVVLVGCGTTKIDPNAPANINDPIVEKAVRKSLKKPEGKLTEADLANVAGLSLSATKITDAGLKEVAKLQELKKLFLFKNQITDASLKELAKLKKLKFLSLANTQVTEAGVAELRKALPNCEIEGP